MDNQNLIYPEYRHRHSPPAAPRGFTAILIHRRHRDFEYFKRRHHHHHHGEINMLIAFAWVNATKREDGSALDPSQISSSVISLVNADGTTTPVATLQGNGTLTSASAPTASGTYNYQVQNVDLAGNAGAAVADIAPVVIESPPAAPSNFTAVLQADPAPTGG